MPGGSVAEMLQKFGPFQIDVIRNYTRQILCGLEYLHSHNIVHRYVCVFVCRYSYIGIKICNVLSLKTK